MLALNGGTPVISGSGSHFTWPPVTEATAKAVLNQLDTAVSIDDRSGVIAELEDALKEYFAARHAVLTSSGTAAVHSAYTAAYVEPGDEVIVPAYTFLATATPLLHLGAIPVLADSDETGNVSVAEVEARITDKTTAIMVTHLWGIPADVDALLSLANRYGLTLLEDASHAHGASVNGKKVGTFGHTAAFSMNGPKPLSAGEGGFVLKFRIHPLAAAVALDQLAYLDDYLAGRESIARYLCHQLGQLPGLAVSCVPEGTRPAWYGLPLTYVPEELDGLPVARFHEALLAEGLTEVDRPGSTCPLNLLPLFRDPAPMLPHYPHLDRVACRDGQFPVAEEVWRHTLKLPVWHREEDLPLVDRYIEGLSKVIENHSELLG